jgi:hypothetical protein
VSPAARRWLWPAAGAALAGLFLAHLAVRYVQVRHQRIADAAAWNIEGPPCPQIGAAELQNTPGKGLQSFTYGDVVFARRFGYVECAPIYEDGGRADVSYPVCQFSRPGDLRIRTQAGEWRFRPGAGRPATVSAPRGQARCVMGARLQAGRAGA